jgi:ATP-binding cassette subfamily A (ABC1) protein 3
MFVRHLQKKFDNGKVAIDDLNLTFYNDEIFALLGHNGAGKTTTLSILTGLIQQSGGYAEAFGRNVFKEMAELRKDMGVCPQHDILFDRLTPREHLNLFCEYKGVPSDKRKEEIDKMLKEVDLLDKQNSQARHLSGGQKRKLSVAIALIGGSKLVLLDEPTSGMDLTARRQLWNMLKG